MCKWKSQFKKDISGIMSGKNISGFKGAFTPNMIRAMNL